MDPEVLIMETFNAGFAPKQLPWTSWLEIEIPAGSFGVEERYGDDGVTFVVFTLDDLRKLVPRWIFALTPEDAIGNGGRDKVEGKLVASGAAFLVVPWNTIPGEWGDGLWGPLHITRKATTTTTDSTKGTDPDPRAFIARMRMVHRALHARIKVKEETVMVELESLLDGGKLKRRDQLTEADVARKNKQ